MRLLGLLLAALSAGYAQLHTSGRYIVDAQGTRVKLAAVNWYGAEEQDYVVAGLDIAPLPAIAQRIRAMGFNTVRLPWSNEMFESNPMIASARLAANPDLKGMRALDVFDAVVNALAAEDLYIVLDNHTSTADWCCSNTDGNGFWYNAAYPESSWIEDWKQMAKRYSGQPAVMGVDLRNEPRGPVWGGSDPRFDWRSAAERAGNAVLSVNPDLLVFVEGVNYAADLTGVRTAPVNLQVAQRLVYSSHDYSWFHNGVTSPATLRNQLNSNWGYLIDAGTPVWVGEFGTCHTANSCISDFWFSQFAAYLQTRDLDWSYWALNGTEASGTGRTLGAEETYGILRKDWAGVASPALLNALQAISVPFGTTGISAGGVVNAASLARGAPVSPGSLASVFGTNLAAIESSASGFPLPTQLGGGSIVVGGVPAPILYASPSQMNIQIPWEVDAPSTPMTAAVLGSTTSASEEVSIATVSPGIFGVAPAVARPGDWISIFCTGLGKVTNQPRTGSPAPFAPLAATVLTPAVRIGPVTVAPDFSGLAPGLAGVYQVNVQVPAGVEGGDAVPVTILIGGVESNAVTMKVQQRVVF